jgi:hypothetical protein
MTKANLNNSLENEDLASSRRPWKAQFVAECWREHVVVHVKDVQVVGIRPRHCFLVLK